MPFLSCDSQVKTSITTPEKIETTSNPTLFLGADQMEDYLPQLRDKNIALVVNQTSTIGDIHLTDTLYALGIQIKSIFAPEHGFRGKADAGAHIDDGIDRKTGIPIISIYGANKKPSKDQLAGIDVVVFDIQDVGARFYTYLSTMHYMMEACAEQDIPVIVLDRPNPNGHYADGPILDSDYRSFVGLHPIPIVHGMTLGELAQMINGQGWLDNQVKCDLTVIPCKNYTRDMTYDLPIKPSPNLPNLKSILLYPSLCLFEATALSIGRGTDQQFQVIGHPDFTDHTYTFTPTSGPGAKYPKHQDHTCHGQSFEHVSLEDIKNWKRLNLDFILAYYAEHKIDPFFNKNLFIDKLAGTDQLRKQIMAGKSAEEIRATWQDGLSDFKRKRAAYLIYP